MSYNINISNQILTIRENNLIRNLIIERSTTKPIVGKYKIFILDECHQLTVQANNALLKILEEPPAHCIYIMCTTDPQKVIPTILSRSFRYDFQLISHQGIINQLQKVLTLEKQDPNGCGVESWDNNSLELIASASAGHMRDALNLLDKSVSYSKNLTVDSVVKVLGVTNYSILFDILDSIIAKDESMLLLKLDELNKSGIDLKLFIKNFLAFVLSINKYVVMKVSAKDLDVMSYISIPRSYEPHLLRYNISHKPIFKQLLKTLLDLNSAIRWETNVKPVLETNLLMEVM